MTPLYLLVRFCLFLVYRTCDCRAWILGRRYEGHAARVQEIGGRLIGPHAVATSNPAERLAMDCKDKAELADVKGEADATMAAYIAWEKRKESLAQWSMWLRRTPGPVGSMLMAWTDAIGTAALFTLTSGFDPLSLGIDASAYLASAWEQVLEVNESPLVASSAKVIAAVASLTLFLLPLLRLRAKK